MANTFESLEAIRLALADLPERLMRVLDRGGFSARAGDGRRSGAGSALDDDRPDRPDNPRKKKLGRSDLPATLARLADALGASGISRHIQQGLRFQSAWKDLGKIMNKSGKKDGAKNIPTANWKTSQPPVRIPLPARAPLPKPRPPLSVDNRLPPRRGPDSTNRPSPSSRIPLPVDLGRRKGRADWKPFSLPTHAPKPSGALPIPAAAATGKRRGRQDWQPFPGPAPSLGAGRSLPAGSAAGGAGEGSRGDRAEAHNLQRELRETMKELIAALRAAEEEEKGQQGKGGGRQGGGHGSRHETRHDASDRSARQSLGLAAKMAFARKLGAILASGA